MPRTGTHRWRQSLPRTTQACLVLALALLCAHAAAASRDIVIYAKYGGTEIKVEGKDLMILNESQILAKKS